MIRASLRNLHAVAVLALARFESVVHDDGFDLERKTHLVVELSIVR
jgi:hypothetical protein